MYKENAHDLNIKYANTVTNYEEHGLVLWSGFDDTADGVLGHGSTTKGKLNNFIVDPTCIRTFEFSTKFVNIPLELQRGALQPWACSGAWLLRRLVRRSAIKGFSHNNYKLEAPITTFFRKLKNSLIPLNFTFDIISCLFSPSYKSYATAWQEIEIFRSIALSPDFALYLNPHLQNKDALLIGSKFGFIGYAYPNRVDIYHQGSYQETTDFFQRNRETTNLTVCHCSLPSI